MIATWDDHEVQNNYANDAEDGGLPLRSRFSRARRDAAYQAFFEAMPVFHRGRSRIYRTEPHGRTLELMMLDERQYRETSLAATRSPSRARAGTGRADDPRRGASSTGSSGSCRSRTRPGS